MTRLNLFFIICLLTLSAAAFSPWTQANQTGFVDRTEAKIHYTVSGEGFPLVLLSGGPGQNSQALSAIVDKLKSNYRVVLIDQRGTGRSTLETLDKTTINIDKYVDDVEAVRKQLKIKQWLILGHSWGGGLAMALSGRHPDSSAGMILVGSMGIDYTFTKHAFDNLKYGEKEQAAFKFWGNPERREANPQRAAYELYRAILPSRVYNQEHVMHIMANHVVEVNGPIIARLMFSQLIENRFDFAKSLKNYLKPVLIVQGRQGFMAGQTVYGIKNAIPNATLKYVEKAGHFTFVEQPEAFFDIVDGFLKQHFGT